MQDATEIRDRTLFEHAPVGVFLFDRDLRVTDCNPCFLRVLQTTRERALGLDLRTLRDRTLLPAFERALAGEASEYEGPYEATTSDVRIFVTARMAPCFDAAGAIEGGMGIIEDVTARRAALEALHRSEARFRALIERSPDPVGVFCQGRRVYASPALAAYLGYATPDEMLGGSVRDHFHPEDVGIFDERAARRAAGAALPPQVFRLVRRDGAVVTAEISSIGIDYDGAPAVLCFFRDLTERKQLQVQLLQAARMAVVGALAAGVAHEVNNPLGYLMGNLEMIASGKLPALDAAARVPGARGQAAVRALVGEVRQMVATAYEGATRVRDIVRDLKLLARGGDDRAVLVDLPRTLDAAIQLAAGELEGRARVVRDYREVPIVEANESRLGLVFLDLLLHAARALPRRGAAGDHEVRVALGTDAAGRAVVEIADDGPGIAPELLGAAFDPFVTARRGDGGGAGGGGGGHGHGGIALSASQAIVAALGGTIEVSSAPGRATVVRVVLPPYAPR